jgi:hypothetical protein
MQFAFSKAFLLKGTIAYELIQGALAKPTCAFPGASACRQFGNAATKPGTNLQLTARETNSL